MGDFGGADAGLEGALFSLDFVFGEGDENCEGFLVELGSWRGCSFCWGPVLDFHVVVRPTVVVDEGLVRCLDL